MKRATSKKTAEKKFLSKFYIIQYGEILTGNAIICKMYMVCLSSSSSAHMSFVIVSNITMHRGEKKNNN